MKIHVVFRTCDKVFSLHNTGRPFGLDKQTVIRICFNSLMNALKGFDFSVHVLGDKLSPEIIKFFEGYPVTLSNGDMGNDESIRQSLRMAYERADDEWVYLCEDDYLHLPNTFTVIRDLIDNRKSVLQTKPKNPFLRLMQSNSKGALGEKPLIIHPPDYPDRYLPRQRRYSLLFLSERSHWRQITNTTFTILAEAKTFKQYRNHFDVSATGADDGLLSRKVYGNRSFRTRALCVSPIPGLTTHMHEGVMTPMVDWEAVARQHLAEIATRETIKTA